MRLVWGLTCGLLGGSENWLLSCVTSGTVGGYTVEVRSEGVDAASGTAAGSGLGGARGSTCEGGDSLGRRWCLRGRPGRLSSGGWDSLGYCGGSRSLGITVVTRAGARRSPLEKG